MHLTLRIPEPATADLLPSENELAQAAGRGVSNAVKSHLVERDSRARPDDGMPHTGYYGDAAGSVTTGISGKTAVITIHKEGIALHYYGGVVYPTDARVLAIPKRADAAGRRPREYDPDRSRLALVWPKGASAGTLRDKTSGDIVYLLVAKAEIPKDETVLPSEGELERAGMSAMEALL